MCGFLRRVSKESCALLPVAWEAAEGDELAKAIITKLHFLGHKLQTSLPLDRDPTDSFI